MRKGWALVQILLVLMVMGAVSVPVAQLTITLLRNIPDLNRVVSSNTVLLHLLARIRNDVSAAVNLPDSVGDFVQDSSTLLLEHADYTVLYKLENETVTRTKFVDGRLKDKHGANAWEIPGAQVDWRVRRRDGKAYAVEIGTHIELKTSGTTQKKLANSRVFFCDLYPEGQE